MPSWDIEAKPTSEPFVQRMRPGRSMSEFDRAALVLFGMFALSKDIESLLRKDKSELVWALSLVVGVTLVVDVASVAARSLTKHGPSWCSWLWYKGKHWFTQLIKLPSAFDRHELLLWQQLFDQLMQTTLDVARARVTIDPADIQHNATPYAEKRWLYYKQYVCDTLMYMATYIAAHERYYKVQGATVYSRFNLFGYAGRDADHICFLITRITKNLHNIAETFMQARTIQEVDLFHVHALYRVTLSMLNKMRLFTSGQLQEHGQDMGEQHDVYQEYITFNEIT